MTLLDTLSSIPNNPLYVNRYHTFITRCVEYNSAHLSSGTYSELHHVLPKSIWPEYEACNWNIVKLTARQHYIAHFILSKAFTGKPGLQMNCAFGMMSTANEHQSRVTSVLYKLSKQRRADTWAEFFSGSNNPFFGKTHSPETIEKIRAANLGKPQSDETKEKRASKLRGLKRSEEFKQRLSAANKGNKNSLGSKRTDESKALLSAANKGSKNPSARAYVVTSPSGECYTVHGALAAFCATHSLSLQKMKTSIGLGVIELTNPKYKYSAETTNCVGWRIDLAV